MNVITIAPPDAPRPKLSMSAWLNTEGGRKCPQCGKYAKPEQLGWVGVSGVGIVLDAYGHLPGFGCNRAAPAGRDTR